MGPKAPQPRTVQPPPRRSDWQADATKGGVQVGASAQSRVPGDAALRSTYVDADEVAMQRALARIGGDDKTRQTGNDFSRANRSRVQAMLEAKAAQGFVPQDPHEQHLARKKKAAGYTTISQRGVNVPRVGVHGRPLPAPPIAYVPHRYGTGWDGLDGWDG